MSKKPNIYTVNLTCQAGTRTRVISEKSESPTLKEAQEFVGGYLQMCPIINAPSKEPVQLYADEDGISKRLPVNANATLTAGYPILGNCLILKGKACWK